MPNQYTKPINHIGQQFGKLTVLSLHHTDKQGSHWLCICECGKTCIPAGISLRKGRSKSCGCTRKITFTNKTHEKSRTPTYNCWLAMIQRCVNPNNKHFSNYGGRGITVCPEWRNSFGRFLLDMGEQPQGMTIERINNDAGYSPSNCKWDTRKNQQRNRRTTRFINAFGQSKSLAEWAEIHGLKPNLITYRIEHGWTPESALTVPPRCLPPATPLCR